MALAVVPSAVSRSSADGLRSAMADMSASLRALEVESVAGDDCASLVGDLTRLEKAVAFTRARLAARAVECGEHVRAGQPNAGEWLSRLTGVGREQSRDELATAVAASSLDGLGSALAEGRLSLRQGHEIAITETEVPGSTLGLIDQAEGSGLKWLKDECRRRREAAADPDDLLARQRRARTLRTWRDAFGMVRISGAFAPLDGIPLLKRLQAEADRLFRAARRAGDDETTPEQLTADALMNLVSAGLEAAGAAGSAGSAGEGGPVGEGTAKSKPSTELVIVADIRSLVAGTVQPGGTCHVLGGGPIPVSEGLALATDAFIKCVTHDGVRIQSVVHYGRRKKLPAVVATALRLGAPPLFHGAACSDRCGCDLGLQIDHVEPVVAGGPTSLANSDVKCTASHKAKTSRERAAGLFGARVSRRRSEPSDGRSPPDG